MSNPDDILTTKRVLRCFGQVTYNPGFQIYQSISEAYIGSALAVDVVWSTTHEPTSVIGHEGFSNVPVFCVVRPVFFLARFILLWC